MDRFSKFYVHVLWWLGYIFVKSPSLEHSNCKFHLASFPTILNILHCISMLLSLFDNARLIYSMKYLPSAYMLIMLTFGVDFATTKFVRILAVKFSHDFLHTWRHLQQWSRVQERGPEARRMVRAAMALVFGSFVHSVYAFVVATMENLQANQFTGLLRNQPVLAIAQTLFIVVTQVTAVPFALPNVVILGSEIVHGYKGLCIAIGRSQGGAVEKKWELKRGPRILARSQHLRSSHLCHSADASIGDHINAGGCFCRIRWPASILHPHLPIVTSIARLYGQCA